MPNVFVPREIRDGETRVAAVAETVQRLIRDGFSVTVQSGAGVASMISDEAFEKALRRFTKSCERAGILSDVKKYRHYEKPSEERKRKLNAARRKRMRDESRRTP